MIWILIPFIIANFICFCAGIYWYITGYVLHTEAIIVIAVNAFAVIINAIILRNRLHKEKSRNS